MRRMLWFACALVLAAGCTAADKAQWQEALKDGRGDNMQMRGFDSSTKRASSQSSY